MTNKELKQQLKAKDREIERLNRESIIFTQVVGLCFVLGMVLVLFLIFTICK